MINLQCKHTWMVRFTNGNIQVHLVGTFRFAIDFIKMVFFSESFSFSVFCTFLRLILEFVKWQRFKVLNPSR